MRSDGHSPTQAHDDEAKQALLRDRPDLAGAYRELVQEGAVTDAEFWQINAAALKTAVAQARRASENPSATGPDAEAASEQQQRARKQAQLLASFPWLRRACHHLVREQGVTVAEFWEKFAEFRRKQSAVLRRRRAGAEVADDIPDDQALAFFLKCQTEVRRSLRGDRSHGCSPKAAALGGRQHGRLACEPRCRSCWCSTRRRWRGWAASAFASWTAP